MKIYILVPVLFLVSVAAFALNGKVMVFDDKGTHYEDADKVDICDAMGNKPQATNNVFVPGVYIPDLRIYHTIEDLYNGYTEYIHPMQYGTRDGAQDGGSVYGGMNPQNKDFFKYECFADPQKTAETYELLGKKDLGGGLSVETYNIRDAVLERDELQSEKMGGVKIGRNTPILPLEVVKDKGRVIWASSEMRFVSVQRRGKGYIVIDDQGIGFLAYKGNTLISEYYPKYFAGAFSYIESHSESPILSARMLTDNIVRIEFKNGLITHWKVKLTKEDCDKNLKSDKNGNEFDHQRAEGSVIWHNGKINKLYFIAWDINTDTSREPKY